MEGSSLSSSMSRSLSESSDTGESSCVCDCGADAERAHSPGGDGGPCVLCGLRRPLGSVSWSSGFPTALRWSSSASLLQPWVCSCRTNNAQSASETIEWNDSRTTRWRQKDRQTDRRPLTCFSLRHFARLFWNQVLTYKTNWTRLSMILFFNGTFFFQTTNKLTNVKLCVETVSTVDCWGVCVCGSVIRPFYNIFNSLIEKESAFHLVYSFSWWKWHGWKIFV